MQNYRISKNRNNIINCAPFSGLPAMETDMLTQLDEPRPPCINIGQDHQADIPETCNDRIDLHRASEQLLWDPGINDALDDNEGKCPVV